LNEQDLMSQLPDEVRALIERPKVLKAAALEALSTTIAELRDEAVAARKSSGIEDTWRECEEAYVGIDDLNRDEFKGAKWTKATTMTGGLMKETGKADSNKATAYVKLVARYVDAGHAKVCEIVLPADGKAFTLKATPLPELAGGVGNMQPAQDITGQPMPGHDGQPVTVDALAKHAIEQAESAAEKAATRIYDWLVEYKHNAEMRKVIFDMARLGVGVLCGPIPESKRVVVVHKTKPATPAAADPDMPPELQATPTAQAAAISVEVVDELKPIARWVDPWNFYPAPGCGENIHKGSHCFESDEITESELAKLAKQGDLFYLPEQIKKVIEEGPGKCRTDGGDNSQQRDKNSYALWNFRGSISKSDFEAANEEQASKVDKAMNRVDVVITLINDTVIRAVQSPMDSGRLPYHTAPWSRRAGHWAGVGVGEQVRTPGRIVTAATRAMLNNAGNSSGAQVIMDPNAVEPANRDMRITPDKLWFIKNGAGVEDVRKVFASFEWPNTTDHLMKIVEYGFKLAEEHSNIPLISQGQSGKTTPDTFGGQQLQDNNANQLLRDVGFTVNDCITTPLVDQFYEWLLLDEDVPDDEKGDYHVDTSGALALIEKSLQDIFVLQLLTASANPAYELDPAKCMEEVIRSKRMTPAHFRLTDAQIEERKKQPPPVAPVVQAAQIRAEVQTKVAESADNLKSQAIKADTDRDTAFVESQARRDQAVQEHAMATLKLQERIADLNYQTKVAEFAMKREISISDAKVELAKVTMQLRTQAALAGHPEDDPTAQVAPSGVEPVGRAPNGHAFQA
jgi:hypothetical protein